MKEIQELVTLKWDKKKKQIEFGGKAKILLPWHTKAISGLRENRLQLLEPKPEEEMFTTPVHLVYHVSASNRTRSLAGFTLKEKVVPNNCPKM